MSDSFRTKHGAEARKRLAKRRKNGRALIVERRRRETAAYQRLRDRGAS